MPALEFTRARRRATWQLLLSALDNDIGNPSLLAEVCSMRNAVRVARRPRHKPASAHGARAARAFPAGACAHAPCAPFTHQDCTPGRVASIASQDKERNNKRKKKKHKHKHKHKHAERQQGLSTQESQEKEILPGYDSAPVSGVDNPGCPSGSHAEGAGHAKATAAQTGQGVLARANPKRGDEGGRGDGGSAGEGS